LPQFELILGRSRQRRSKNDRSNKSQPHLRGSQSNKPGQQSQQPGQGGQQGDHKPAQNPGQQNQKPGQSGTLKQEKAADQLLTKIAESGVNTEAR
jgi:hypothetical protein